MTGVAGAAAMREVGNVYRCDSRRLSTPCFAGIVTRLNAMSIYQMFRQLSGKQAISSPSLLGNRLFGQADGLLGVEHSKSFWLPLRSNSSRGNARDLVT